MRNGVVRRRAKLTGMSTTYIVGKIPLTQNSPCHNSRLYSEKAYVLSRGFVRRALEVPLGGGFDEVVKVIYYARGRLCKVVQSSRQLIEDSNGMKDDEGISDAAVPKLTPGGIIMLTRTLDKLEGLLSTWEQDSSKDTSS